MLQFRVSRGTSPVDYYPEFAANDAAANAALHQALVQLQSMREGNVR